MNQLVDQIRFQVTCVLRKSSLKSVQCVKVLILDVTEHIHCTSMWCKIYTPEVTMHVNMVKEILFVDDTLRLPYVSEDSLPESAFRLNVSCKKVKQYILPEEKWLFIRTWKENGSIAFFGPNHSLCSPKQLSIKYWFISFWAYYFTRYNVLFNITSNVAWFFSFTQNQFDIKNLDWFETAEIYSCWITTSTCIFILGIIDWCCL